MSRGERALAAPDMTNKQAAKANHTVARHAATKFLFKNMRHFLLFVTRPTPRLRGEGQRH
jgi:hypothetical protein